MLQIQMYRGIFAGFFLMVALYFTFAESRRIPLMTLLSATALFLTHVIPSLLYLATIFVYGLLNRKEADGKRCAILFAFLMGILPFLMIYFSPYSWVYEYVRSFALAKPPLIAERIYFLRHALVLGAVLIAVSVPTLVRLVSSWATRHDLALAVLLGLSLSTLPLLVGGYERAQLELVAYGIDQPLLIPWLDLEFPIAILAARTIEKNSRGRSLLLLVIPFVIASSWVLVSRYFY